MNGLRRVMSLLLAVLLLCSLTSAYAAKPTPTPNPDAIVEPTLAPDAPKYDKEHPEDLDPDQLYAYSALLVAQESGEIIFSKDPDTRRYPASTTKILTVWLGIMRFEDDLDHMVTVSERAVDIPDDSSTMSLKAGEEISFRDILYGTMLLSANDGANVIAEEVSGSIEAFVALMNQVVDDIGCRDTHFVNPHGYPNDDHYSTASDMALIAATVMQNETFAAIANTRTWSVAKTNMHRARSMENSNLLLKAPTEESSNGYYYEFATGMKTGSSKSSGYCFIGAAEKDGVKLISVVMYTGKYSRWKDTIKLFDYGFSQYMCVTPVELYNANPITLETSGYALDDPNMGKLLLKCTPVNKSAAANAKIIATKEQVDAMKANIQETVYIQYVRDFIAPIEAGETMAKMTYFTENGDIIEYNLTADRTIERRKNAPKTLAEIVQMVNDDPNPYPPLTVELVILALLPFVCLFLLIYLIILLRRRRRRKAARFSNLSQQMPEQKKDPDQF